MFSFGGRIAAINPGNIKTALLKDYEIKSLLGKGSFGEVYEVLDKTTGQRYAVKTLLRKELGKNEEIKSRVEYNILEHLSSECVPKVIHYFQDDEKIYIVMELLSGYDFEKYILNVYPIPDETLFSFWEQLSNCLNFIHSKGVVHRDIKNANIMLSDGIPKFVDFGVAVMKGVNDRYYSNLSGTLKYQPPIVHFIRKIRQEGKENSPEYRKYIPRTDKEWFELYKYVDFWGLCVTMLCLINGRNSPYWLDDTRPFLDEDDYVKRREWDFINKVLSGVHPRDIPFVFGKNYPDIPDYMVIPDKIPHYIINGGKMGGSMDKTKMDKTEIDKTEVDISTEIAMTELDRTELDEDEDEEEEMERENARDRTYRDRDYDTVRNRRGRKLDDIEEMYKLRESKYKEMGREENKEKRRKDRGYF